jgi:HNH endonuclease/NUMOD4 motif
MKNLPNEEWAILHFRNRKGTRKYAVSNCGRILSFKETIADGKILSLTKSGDNVEKLTIVLVDGRKSFTVHHLVAKKFLSPAPSSKHTYVIHLDKNHHNNHVKNLRYVTYEESVKHISGKTNTSKLKIFVGEQYKQLVVEGTIKKYAITNYGRLISYINKVEEGTLVEGSLHNEGYRIWRYKANGQYNHALLHRLVATHFLEQPTPLHKFVIHKDNNKTNNAAKNLMWATQEQVTKNASNSLAVKKALKKFAKRSQLTGKGKKLTEGKVKMIKKILSKPVQNTRMKMLAKQFDISPMQLGRIKSGENWGWVKID